MQSRFYVYLVLANKKSDCGKIEVSFTEKMKSRSHIKTMSLRNC